MHVVNHAAVGAGIALIAKDPVVALPAALVSHYALDALPHYGIRGDEGYSALFKHRRSYLMVMVDVTGLLLLLLLVWGQAWYVYGAIVAALLPDIAWPYRYVRYEIRRKKPKNSILTRFHQRIQWGETLQGIYLEIPLALALLTGVSHLL